LKLLLSLGEIICRSFLEKFWLLAGKQLDDSPWIIALGVFFFALKGSGIFVFRVDNILRIVSIFDSNPKSSSFSGIE